MKRLMLVAILLMPVGCNKVDVEAPGVKVKVGGGGVSVDAPGAKVQTGSGGVKVDVNKDK